MKLEKFYQWLQLNKNSKKTIDSYYQQINCFGKYCDYKFNQNNLDKYLIKLKEENKSLNTINLFKNAMFAYLEYADIKLNIPSPKKVKRKEIKFYFTEDDMKEVYKNLTLINGDYNLKELILRFMFYTGARSNELLDLKVDQINFKTKNIKFLNGKGEKDRIVPFLNTKLFNDLKIYCDGREENVFNFSYNQLLYLLKQVKKILQINKDEIVEPRTMRISFAKNCVSKGMNILILKKLMGHTDIKVTEMYAEPDDKMIKEACEKIRKGEMK